MAAGRAESVSAWVNEALRMKADHDRRLQALDEFVAAYEAEHGEITGRRCARPPAERADGRWWCVASRGLPPGRGGAWPAA